MSITICGLRAATKDLTQRQKRNALQKSYQFKIEQNWDMIKFFIFAKVNKTEEAESMLLQYFSPFDLWTFQKIFHRADKIDFDLFHGREGFEIQI